MANNPNLNPINKISQFIPNKKQQNPLINILGNKNEIIGIDNNKSILEENKNKNINNPFYQKDPININQILIDNLNNQIEDDDGINVFSDVEDESKDNKSYQKPKEVIAIVRHKFLQTPQIIKEMNSIQIFCKVKILQLALQATITHRTISIDFKVISLEKLQVFKYKVRIHTIQADKVIPLKF